MEIYRYIYMKKIPYTYMNIRRLKTVYRSIHEENIHVDMENTLHGKYHVEYMKKIPYTYMNIRRCKTVYRSIHEENTLYIYEYT